MTTYINDNLIVPTTPIKDYLLAPMPNNEAIRANVYNANYSLCNGYNYEQRIASNEAAIWHNENSPLTLNANRTLTVYNYDNTSRYGNISFWANHVNGKKILEFGNSANIATGIALFGDLMTYDGLIILDSLKGWNFWQFRKTSSSLIIRKNTISIFNWSIVPTAMTGKVWLNNNITNLMTTFDTTSILVLPTRE